MIRAIAAALSVVLLTSSHAAVDIKAVRARRLEKLSTALSDYRSLVAKILTAESKEKEHFAAEKAALDKIELSDTTFRSQINNYLLEEHRGRINDLRSLVGIAGQEFNIAADSIKKQAENHMLGRASSNASPSFAKTELGMESYRNRLRQFVSPSLLANGGKVEIEKISSDELLKVNGTDYAPTFKWGAGLMNDGQYIYQNLPEYVDFLNGKDTTNFAISSDKSITFKGRSYEFAPTVFKDKLYISLAQNDPEAYKKWKARVDGLLEARLLRAQIARLKRNIALYDRPSRSTSIELHAADRLSPSKALEGDFVIMDRFGRDISIQGIPLVDWDGYIANPALKFNIKTSGLDDLNLNVVLISSNSRLHFSHTPESPCVLDANRARKHLLIPPSLKASEFLISIWPDRDGQSEDHEVEAYYWFGKEKHINPWIEIPSNAKVTRISVHVNDLDSEQSAGVAEVITAVPPFPFVEAPPDAPFLTLPFPFQSQEFTITESDRFTINLDFSLDKTGFFTDDESGAAERRAVFKQAAQDLSYFIKASLGRTSRGADSISLANGGGDGTAEDSMKLANRYAYKDFLIYVRGVPGTTEPAARAGRLLQDDSKSIGRLTQGHVTSGEVLVSGVASPEKFIVDPFGDQWWKLSWDPGKPVDLYSWAGHEQLHAFAFSDAHAAFKGWKTAGKVDAPHVVAYHGRPPVLTEKGHLDHEIDVESQRGAFGVIDGNMPAQQWLLTKLDLFMLAAHGYTLQANALWGELSFRDDLKANLTAGRYINTQVKALTGIPPYYWKLEAGEIPRGLVLNSYTGEISGSPESAGEYHFILSVKDSSNTDTIPQYLYKMMTVAPNDSR